MSDDTPSGLNNVITHLDQVVRGTVEETLNALRDAEADRLCNAQRYERSEARRDTRAGSCASGRSRRASSSGIGGARARSRRRSIDTPSPMNNVITIDDEPIKSHRDVSSRSISTS